MVKMLSFFLRICSHKTGKHKTYFDISRIVDSFGLHKHYDELLLSNNWLSLQKTFRSASSLILLCYPLQSNVAQTETLWLWVILLGYIPPSLIPRKFLAVQVKILSGMWRLVVAD